MALNLYRRHHRTPGKCAGGHPPDSRNYEPEELRRNWKKCHCPTYACGILDGKFQRKNTKKTTWSEAKAAVAEWESAGSWGASPASPEPEIVATGSEPAKPSITIEFATEAYLANRAGRSIAPATLRKYKTFAKQFRDFAAEKGYVMVDQIEITDMDEFYSR